MRGRKFIDSVGLGAWIGPGGSVNSAQTQRARCYPGHWTQCRSQCRICSPTGIQSCRVSCHGRAQSIPAGGPTTLRSNFRNKTSKLRRSALYIVRCPAAKTDTGEITASKYRSLFPSDTFLSHNVARWQKNAFDAACKCWSTSCRFLITVGILNMQPSHLWHDYWLRISICKPAGVDRTGGGWASVVITLVLSVFNTSPTWDKHTTSSSKSRPASVYVEMIETLSWELRHIGLQVSAAKSKIFTTKQLDHPMYVEVSQDLVHVLHALKKRGCVELHHRKTIAWAKFNKHRTVLTNKHVSLKLRLKFFNGQCCCHASHDFQFAHVGIDESAVKKPWRITAQNVAINCWVVSTEWRGLVWHDASNESPAQCGFGTFPYSTMDGTTCQTPISPWSSIAGHWTCTTGWLANFGPSRKRGRPLVKWDDKLSKTTAQYVPPHYRWPTAAKMPSWQNARHYFVSHFVDL